jgi:hypothetical protein
MHENLTKGTVTDAGWEAERQKDFGRDLYIRRTFLFGKEHLEGNKQGNKEENTKNKRQTKKACVHYFQCKLFPPQTQKAGAGDIRVEIFGAYINTAYGFLNACSQIPGRSRWRSICDSSVSAVTFSIGWKTEELLSGFGRVRYFCLPLSTQHDTGTYSVGIWDALPEIRPSGVKLYTHRLL